MILSWWYNYPLEKFPVIAFAKDPKPELLNTAALGVMIFLLVTHVLNWWNDWIGYKASAYKNGMPGSFNITGYWGAIKAIIEGKEPEMELKQREWDKDVDRLHKHLDKTLREFSVAQWVQIYLQHLTTPLLIAVIAIACLF